MVSFVLAQTEMTQCGEASRPIFHCAELFSKGDLKSKRSKETVLFESTTDT